MIKRKQRKDTLKLFFKYLCISILLEFIITILLAVLYYSIMNKTEVDTFQDEVKIIDTYKEKRYNREEYITEFDYKGYRLKSIGYNTYFYCLSLNDVTIKADIIQTTYINRKPQRVEYQILKIYTKY